MDTEIKFTAGTIKVGGENQSVEYCWQRRPDRLRLIIRYEDGTIETFDDAPSDLPIDYTRTLEIVEALTSGKMKVGKFLFKRKLKGE